MAGKTFPAFPAHAQPAILRICQEAHALLSRAADYGMKFKWEKCEFRKTELSLMGHVITRAGLQADPLKVEAILALKTKQFLSLKFASLVDL